MEVVLLGTGAGLAGGGTALLRHGRTTIAVDCGPGTAARLAPAGAPAAGLDALLVTRLEPERLADLLPLLLRGAVEGRTRPQRVFGPPGIAPLIEALVRAWGEALARQAAALGRAAEPALRFEVGELSALATLRVGTLDLGVVPLSVPGLDHAYGYAAEAGGLRSVLAGPTRSSEMLLAAARDADLLLRDLGSAEEVGEAAMVAARARVGCFALAAMPAVEGLGADTSRADPSTAEASEVGEPPDAAALIAEIATVYRGPVVIGRDLLAIDLVARTLAWRGLVVGLGVGAAL